MELATRVALTEKSIDDLGGRVAALEHLINKIMVVAISTLAAAVVTLLSVVLKVHP